MDELLYKLVKTPEDINKLIEAHKNLVYKVLADFGYLGIPEYESAGIEALWNAISTYDVFAETAFSTYAYACIKNAVNNVYRTEAKRRQHFVTLDLTDNELEPLAVDITMNIESEEAVQAILMYVRDYLDSLRKDTIGYKAMQLWYSTQFTLSPSEIASRVGTSSSIVCRAQQLLRAYLSRRIYEAKKKEETHEWN